MSVGDKLKKAISEPLANPDIKRSKAARTKATIAPVDIGLNVTKEEISTKGIIIKTVIYLFLPKIQPDQLLFVFEFDYLQTFRAFVLE